MEKLIRLDALRNDAFSDNCDLLIKKKLEELHQKLLPVSSNDTNTEETDIGDDFGETTIRRPRRTASRTADLKIKKNLNMPLKLRRPSTDSSHNGTFKFPKTTRTRVLKKTAADKSVDALDEMNLVKKRTEQFEKMSKDQQVTLTPNRRNEAGVNNINECVAIAVATSSLDNANNNVVSTATSSVVEEECTTTTTTTRRVTRTRTRNANKQVSGDEVASSCTEDVFVKPSRTGRTKLRKELASKLGGALEDDESELTRVDRDALAQKAREKELARKAKEKAEEEARRAAEEAAKAAEEKARRAEEEARRAEEAKRQELERKEKERAREEKLAKAQEAAAKKKEADTAKKLAVLKKRQEMQLKLAKKEAIKKKHDEINKQRELDAEKRKELLQASAAKKKEAAEASSKTQHKAADAKENMKPNHTTKPPVKPGHPVVSQLKNATFTSSNYNMTPPREEREPQKPKTADDYGIDDAASSDSSDDETNPKKMVPDWAKSSKLNEMIETLSYIPVDFFRFMMSCDTEPYQTLDYVNKIKRQRTSSAVWHTPLM